MTTEKPIWMSFSHYQKHLNPQEKSIEYAINRCMNVLAMIAKLKDRNRTIENMCEDIFGKNEDGLIIAGDIEAEKHLKNLKMIRRLKAYYNSCLSRVEGF